MKATNKLALILTVGALMLLSAWGYRRKVDATRARLAPADTVQMQALRAQTQKLQAAVAKNPQDLQSRYELAHSYVEQGQLGQGAEQLKLIISHNPEFQPAYLALANTELASKHLDEAEHYYEIVVKKWPKDAEARQGLAVALFRQHRYLEAIGAGRAAVKLRPDIPANHYVLARALLEYALQFPTAVDVGMYSAELHEARTELESIIAKPQQSGFPYYSDAYYQLGRVYSGLRDAKNAIKVLRRAQQLLPAKADIAIQLAKLYKASAQNQVALQVVEQALPKNPQSAALFDLEGQLRENSGDPQALQQTYDAFQKAVQLAPSNASIRERFGVACLRLNKFDEARAAFEESVRLNPNRAFPYQQLAAIYARQGKAELATKFARQSTIMVFNDRQLKQIMGVSAEHPESVPVHLILADRYRDLGYLGAARDEYLLVRRLDPANQRAGAGLAAVARAQVKADAKPTASATTAAPR